MKTYARVVKAHDAGRLAKGLEVSAGRDPKEAHHEDDGQDLPYRHRKNKPDKGHSIVVGAIGLWMAN